MSSRVFASFFCRKAQFIDFQVACGSVNLTFRSSGLWVRGEERNMQKNSVQGSVSGSVSRTAPGVGRSRRGSKSLRLAARSAGASLAVRAFVAPAAGTLYTWNNAGSDFNTASDWGNNAVPGVGTND